MAEILPFTSYFPQQSLMEAKMQGEQLRSMQGQRKQQEAQQQAISDIYGSPEEAARQGIMQQQQDDQFNRFTKTADFLESVFDSHGQEAVNALLQRPEIAKNVSPYAKEGSFIFDRDRKGTTRARYLPAQDTDGIDASGNPMTLKADTPYFKIKEPGVNGKEYFVEDIKTVEDRNKIEGGKDAATALQKNTSFIAKTLKIPKEKALQMAMESKVQSRESFIMGMVGRLVSSSMGRADVTKINKMKKNAGDLWDSLNKDKFGATGGAPEAQSEQDWLGATLEEE